MGGLEMNALAKTLAAELDWAARLIDVSIHLYFGQECAEHEITDVLPPVVAAEESVYADCVHSLNFDARAVLILALIPYLRPQLLDPFLMKNELYGRSFTEFGGTVSPAGFAPTLETAAFVLAGNNLERRLQLQRALSDAAFFDGQLLLEDLPGQVVFSTPLVVRKEQLARLTTGENYHPAFNNHFPAQALTTAFEWSDLVLDDNVMDEVEDIRAWIQHGTSLMDDWHLRRQIKPGFRSLFYGPPGTGKTMTAALLGKVCGRDVYRIDLSLVVSKYIGETEKNLAGVFDLAAYHDWILFFDEADALFGKRTQTSSSHDRYANQEVAFLLQKLEDFPGIVILASNLKSNMDEAFARRFQSMVQFHLPGVEERLRLWRQAFQDTGRLDEAVDLHKLAREHEMSGGAIINVLRYSALMALRRNADKVGWMDIQHGIRREQRKEGKLV